MALPERECGHRDRHLDIRRLKNFCHDVRIAVRLEDSNQTRWQMFDAKKYAREYAKALSEKRIVAGLCVKCGKNSVEGRRVCRDCGIKDKERSKRRQKKLSSLGLCKMCGQLPVDGDHKYCGGCLKRANASSRLSAARRHQEGRCFSCGKPKENAQKQSCIGCQKKSNEKTRKLRAERQANGLCRTCGAEGLRSKTGLRSLQRKVLCKNCYLKVLAKNCLGAEKLLLVLVGILEKHDWRCFYTGEKLIVGENLSIDHLDPVGRFPERKHDPENLVPCTWQVNLMKRDKTKDEFLAAVMAIARHHQGA